jgi:hypothetical protein
LEARIQANEARIAQEEEEFGLSREWSDGEEEPLNITAMTEDLAMAEGPNVTIPGLVDDEQVRSTLRSGGAQTTPRIRNPMDVHSTLARTHERPPTKSGSQTRPVNLTKSGVFKGYGLVTPSGATVVTDDDRFHSLLTQGFLVYKMFDTQGEMEQWRDNPTLPQGMGNWEDPTPHLVGDTRIMPTRPILKKTNSSRSKPPPRTKPTVRPELIQFEDSDDDPSESELEEDLWYGWENPKNRRAISSEHASPIRLVELGYIHVITFSTEGEAKGWMAEGKVRRPRPHGSTGDTPPALYPSRRWAHLKHEKGATVSSRLPG